jgi:uncharacterized membrane protein
MKKGLAHALDVALCGSAFALAGALYGRLPRAVPTHWNLHGQADSFVAKPWGPFVLPLVMTGLYAVLAVLPRISPRGFRMESFARVYGIVRTSVLAFLLVLTALSLISAMGAPLGHDRTIGVAVGLLFVVLGNLMGKVRRNFFVGIRTPWTLASEEVWLRTHRLGGKLFVLAGLAAIVIGLAGGGMPVLLAILLTAAFVPAVYSYVLYRRIEHDDAPGSSS